MVGVGVLMWRVGAGYGEDGGNNDKIGNCILIQSSCLYFEYLLYTSSV